MRVIERLLDQEIQASGEFMKVVVGEQLALDTLIVRRLEVEVNYLSLTGYIHRWLPAPTPPVYVNNYITSYLSFY